MIKTGIVIFVLIVNTKRRASDMGVFKDIGEWLDSPLTIDDLKTIIISLMVAFVISISLAIYFTFWR